MTARERIDALLDEGSFVEFDELARHRSTAFGMDDDPAVRRRRGHRLRHGRRPPGLRVRPGLHGLRRLAGRGVRREDRQGHGPRAEDRLPGHRHQRLRRRPHPGGRRLARPLRRDLLPQRDGLRRRPADLADHGPVRRRRRLLPGDHRLHRDGRPDVAHVHHRPRRHQDGHRRGRHLRGARRRAHPQHQVRRRALHGRRRGRRLEYVKALLSYLPSNNLEDPPAYDAERRCSRSPTPTASSTRSSPTRRTSPTTCTP